MYEDPPEPTQEEIEEFEATKAAEDAPVRIEGVTLGMIRATIAGILESRYTIQNRIDEVINREVAKRVSALFEGAVQERVTAAIDAAIAAGFPVFDRYSGRETARTSVVELVHKALTEKVGERGYDDNTGTAAERAVRTAVQKLFETELKAEVEKLKESFRKQADAVFQAKIVASLKEAIGLR